MDAFITQIDARLYVNRNEIEGICPVCCEYVDKGENANEDGWHTVHEDCIEEYENEGTTDNEPVSMFSMNGWYYWCRKAHLNYA